MKQRHIIDPDGDITICMPYFERLAPLENTIKSFRKHGYFEQNIHLSIVDDGSIREPIPECYDEYSWCTVERLEKKAERKNACTPMNIAVRNATGQIILLQSPETSHTGPIAKQMAESIKNYKDIVLAAVSSNREDFPWYSHPIHRPEKFWFCQMMSKKLFDEVDGFSEEYRNGLGWEDNDFARKLDKVKANWVWREDCVAHHHFIPGVTGTIPGTKDINQGVHRRKWKRRKK